jgi:DNA-binding PadR family transcriptional regulator
MEMTTSGYVILGMVANGSRTGYEVRRSASLSLRYFWSISPPQIYTELDKLEKAGFLVAEDDPRNNRRRRVYSLTPDGRTALRDWLLKDEVGEFQIRDLLELKFFFSDILPSGEASQLVENLRRRSQHYLHILDDEVQPFIERSVSRHGLDNAVRIAEFHHELHEFILAWCDRVEMEVEASAVDDREAEA